MPMLNLPVGYEETDCPTCGVLYFVSENWLAGKRRTGGDGYCPNGHLWTFRTTEFDKIRRERNWLKQQLAERDDRIGELHDLHDHQKHRTAAYKGQVTKLKKRASAGVCPCCTRSFQNLRKHMYNKHPDYIDTPDLEVIEGGAA